MKQYSSTLGMLLYGPQQRKNYAHYLLVHNRMLPRMLVREMVREGYKKELLEILAAYKDLSGQEIYVDTMPILHTRKEWLRIIASGKPHGRN